MKIDDFNALCTRFAERNKHLLRPAGIEKVRQAIAEEHNTVLIISASIDNWVRPFFDEIDKNIQVLGTQIETKERSPNRTIYHEELLWRGKGEPPYGTLSTS